MKKLLLIFLFLLGVAVLATVAGILMGGKGSAVGEGPTVLVWRLAGPVLEQREPRLPFSDAAAPVSIAELYPALRAARQDAGVRGLAVYIQEADLGLAKAQELRRQMMALRRAGKFVECYLETAGEGSNGTLAYYLATACETIYLAPARGPQPARALLREPVPARRARQAQDRPRLQPRRPLQERRRVLHRDPVQPRGRGGDRRGARRLLRADRRRHRRGAPQERRRGAGADRRRPLVGRGGAGARPGRPALLPGRVQGPPGEADRAQAVLRRRRGLQPASGPRRQAGRRRLRPRHHRPRRRRLGPLDAGDLSRLGRLRDRAARRPRGRLDRRGRPAHRQPRRLGPGLRLHAARDRASSRRRSRSSSRCPTRRPRAATTSPPRPAGSWRSRPP